MSDLDGSKYARTLRHLRPWQVIGRLVAPVRRRLARWRLPDAPPRLAPSREPTTSFPAHDPWNTRAGIRQGRFQFLNEPAVLGRPVDWAATSMPLLWRFNLHYFHYLFLLAPDEQVALCREWVDSNPAGRGVGWHPYPTSLRIVNWCRAGLDVPDLLGSLYQQAAYLYRNLETHVYGNHLLENARALVMAGAYLAGQGESEAWMERGLALYYQETPEQILGDGFHYERSPMYHALMLEGYLDVLNMLPEGHPERDGLAETARAMTDALAGITHPDGQIALFNDSTLEIAPPPADLFAYAKRVLGHPPQPRRRFPDTGYFVYKDNAAWLMVDGGPAGPEYLMAHAHADIFSFELSLRDVRFVVDTGVYEYPAGPMRQHVRSTAAHNTVAIDGTDQVECWDSFRVARRAAPHDVSWAETERGAVFEGTYSGYARLIGDQLAHRRRLTIDGDRRTLTVEDEITGEGQHHVASRLHLHPEVTVRDRPDGWVLQREGCTCTVSVDGAPARWETGWYCPRFGIRKKNKVLVLHLDATLPKLLRYTLRY